MARRTTTRRSTGGSASDPPAFSAIDGASGVVAALKREMALVARDPFVTVLVQGESGTGKERVARAIHAASTRAALPFVVVNCAGLSPSLVEDELFGHLRGAFTGAHIARPGPFEAADGGTVLLDEVGALPIELQARLLRVLQARTVCRLGSWRETPFDVRVMAATNVDLARASAAGQFRDDLFHRLRVYELHVPPLRHRGPADLAALTRAIVEQLALRRHRQAPRLDAGTLAVLARHAWPGNVRELENVLERALVAAGDASTLTPAHLPTHLLAIARPPADTLTFLAARRALAASRCHRSRAAASLGISRHQLYRLLRRGPACDAVRR